MDVSYESVDKNQRTGERTKTEDRSNHAFRTRVLTKNKLDMHRAHAKQGTVSEQELSQVWPGGVTERRDGKYCRRKRGPYSEMLSGKNWANVAGLRTDEPQLRADLQASGYVI